MIGKLVQVLIAALTPVLADLVIKFWDRYQNDERFRHEIDIAMGGHATALNREQRMNAKRAIQRAIGTRRG